MAVLFGLNTSANDIKSYMIIVGGGKTVADANKAKETYISKTVLKNQIQSNIEIVLSDTVSDLNSSFYIAIIGYCKTKDYADLILQVANKQLKGVYKREVNVKSSLVLSNTILFGRVRYLSELDFSKLTNFEEDKAHCDVESHVYESDPNDPWNGTELTKETCFYKHGIISIAETVVEGGILKVKFPRTEYSFREVLFYYLQRKHFEDLLRIDFSYGKHSYEDSQLEWKENEISLSFPGSWECIKIEDNYIVFYSENGA